MTDAERTEMVSGRALTVREAATISGMGRSWLYMQMDAGNLAYMKMGDKSRRIPEVALRRMMADALVLRD